MGEQIFEIEGGQYIVGCEFQNMLPWFRITVSQFGITIPRFDITIPRLRITVPQFQMTGLLHFSIFVVRKRRNVNSKDGWPMNCLELLLTRAWHESIPTLNPDSCPECGQGSHDNHLLFNFFCHEIIFSRPMDSLGESSQSAATFLGMSLGGEEDDEDDWDYLGYNNNNMEAGGFFVWLDIGSSIKWNLQCKCPF